jgi:subtilisin family serine protease
MINDDGSLKRTPRGRLRGGAWFSSISLAAVALFAGCSGDGVEAPLSQKQEALSPTAGSSGAVTLPTLPSKERTVWVVMKQRPTLSGLPAGSWNARGQAVYERLTQNARSSQGALKSWLTQRNVAHKGFWGVNTVKVTADAGTIAQIAQRADVARIVEDGRVRIPEPDPVVVQQAVQAIEWNIEEVRAPEAWSDFGTRGEGVVVATIDTGAQFDHPALVNQYRGLASDGSVDHNYNWFDPSNVCGFPSITPCDNAGHGTHTMGTIVGDDGGENQIGVAPEATWITAKGCEDFFCSFEALIASGEWMLAPTDLNGANPRPDLRPNLVSNSWGGGGGDLFYQEIVDNWIAAGIFPVFANGNSGSFCGSSGSPGDYEQSYSAGAYDQFGIIADFSSRGPSMLGGIKPNIAAPGVNVRSAVPGDSYDFFSGTSMATPHVAGAIALLWSAAPALLGDVAATREILDTSAIDTEDLSCGGDAANNNTWGQGKLDVVAALELAPIGPTGFLAGTVTDLGGAAISGARIATTGAANRVRLTDADGAYSIRLPVGGYSVEASAFGYLTESVSGADITEGMTTTLPFDLDVAPSFNLDGTVSDAAGAPIAGAEVQVVGTPLPRLFTDSTGYFNFGPVPQGVYTVTTAAGGCYSPDAQEVTLEAPETLAVALPSVTDAYGYQCHPTEFEYIPGTTPIGTFDDDLVTVDLPFEFTFYGATYDRVEVDSNGLVSFTAPFSNPFNTAIPNPQVPNAAIYALWDDLYPFDPSHILTGVEGTAPNRKFVIEWRDVPFLESFDETASFEIVLHESGEITTSYLTDASPRARGRSATAGIENATGDIALQYSNNTESLRAGLSVMYEVPFSGFVQGAITDANDLGPLGGATVTATNADGISRSTTTSAAGTYRLQLTEGDYVVSVSKTHYQTQTFDVTVVEDGTVVRDLSLATARGAVTPSTLQLVVPVNSVRTRTLTLSNTGSLAMDFTIAEAGGRRQTTAVTGKRKKAQGFDPLARTTKNLYEVQPTPPPAATPAAPGDILFSFPPTGASFAWGIGQGRNLWVSDINMRQNREFTPEGSGTGVFHDAPWAGDWPGDMAYDHTRDAVCQVAVGADNGIHCWNQDSGAVVYSIAGSPWTGISQRGVAYDGNTDTFFVGGWNEGIIYHVQGLSGASPGSVISSCMPADGNISGLAYNEAMDVLWVATNSDTDMIYEVNPYDCTVLSTLAPPQGGMFQGAGLELDPEGNLWAIAQSPNMVYLVESGVPSFSDVPWLSETPSAGQVAAGGSTNVTVTIDTTGMTPGLYLATLFVLTNSGREPTLRIPVSLVVSGYIQGVNSSSKNYVDSTGETWVKTQKHVAGSWGYIQKGTTRSTNKNIAGTPDPTLYKTQHEDPYAYRFDNVPNGIYEIDLRSAELQGNRPGQRLFDVIIENSLVLPAHDIFYEVDGAFIADDHRFFIEVTDGRMDVRFIARAGSKKPVINALRITHRPDR